MKNKLGLNTLVCLLFLVSCGQDGNKSIPQPPDTIQIEVPNSDTPQLVENGIIVFHDDTFYSYTKASELIEKSRPNKSVSQNCDEYLGKWSHKGTTITIVKKEGHYFATMYEPVLNKNYFAKYFQCSDGDYPRLVEIGGYEELTLSPSGELRTPGRGAANDRYTKIK